jgi:hypothetical protein
VKSICIIGKSPPIQGGVSRTTFWWAYALSSQGVDVHLVTNSREVEYQFRISELTQVFTSAQEVASTTPGNFTIHYTSNPKEISSRTQLS